MTLLFSLSAALAVTAAIGHAADTAYTALRVFGKKEGEQALYRVVELRGKSGTPQPGTWKLTVEDQRARGGVREIEVRGGKMVSERSPTGRDFPPAMNFNQLNLDSDGAFTVANQEAEKRGTPFDRIDYTLRSGRGGVPTWTVELYEARHGQVGMLRISADSGSIVEQNFASDRRYAGDRAYVEGENRGQRRVENRDEHDLGDDIGSFMKRVGRHFEKRGRQLSNFFTGH